MCHQEGVADSVLPCHKWIQMALQHEISGTQGMSELLLPFQSFVQPWAVSDVFGLRKLGRASPPKRFSLEAGYGDANNSQRCQGGHDMP